VKKITFIAICLFMAVACNNEPQKPAEVSQSATPVSPAGFSSSEVEPYPSPVEDLVPIPAAPVAADQSQSPDLTAYPSRTQVMYTSEDDVKKRGESVFLTAANAELTGEKNIAYAAAFQIAWDTLIEKIVKEKIQLEGNPRLAQILNAGTISKKDLSEKDYFTDAGFKKDGIEQRVRDGLKKKFNTEPINDIRLGHPEDILAYAYLYKNIRFEPKFEREHNFSFFPAGGRPQRVEAFGLKSYKPHDKIQAETAKNIKINYYTAASFVVTIRAKDSEDEIIFALIPREETLGAAIKKALSLRKENTDMAEDDSLLIPEIRFDVTEEYKELYKVVLNSISGLPPRSYKITKALQTVKFDMDYEGVKLIAEAVIGMSGAAGPGAPRPQPKFMHFNRPFLLMMKEKDGQNPYFALWVENEKILTNYKRI
jgi:hypothetical protein